MRGTRTVRALVVAALALAGAPVLAATGTAVLVSADAGSGAAAAAVTAAGGRVVETLPLSGSVLARLPRSAHLPSGVRLVGNRTLRVAGATADANGTSTVRATLGLATDGTEGDGVTVALVDTGVAAVPSLAGSVAAHLNATGGADGDGYGHGTFLAGLVAQVAPGARLVDVKVADGDGTTSLATVLRGLELVARRRDVDVVNLALSSGSDLPWQLDPLTRALDALWRRGVVVVVPAGNDGPDLGTVTSPGVDPTLLTVAAVDENGTADRTDDVVPDWSSRGPAAYGVAKPDLAAPGAHLVSLRAPGSTIDLAHPEARVGDAYFRGSGTSMATAVTSGAVAALLAARPKLSPDAVKSVLVGSTYDAPGLADPDAAGTGGLDLAAAYDTRPSRGARGRARVPRTDADAWSALSRAWVSGDASAAARAWALLSPEARAWAARAWAAAVWSRASSWSGDEWAARAWAARAWAARTWAGDEWLARAWAARAWADTDWAARAWADASWVGRAWAGDDWAARAWAGRAWAGRAWADQDWVARAWTARAWTDDDWSARAWTARAWTARGWAAGTWDAAG